VERSFPGPVTIITLDTLSLPAGLKTHSTTAVIRPPSNPEEPVGGIPPAPPSPPGVRSRGGVKIVYDADSRDIEKVDKGTQFVGNHASVQVSP
jgi:hypothetical protein